MEKDNTTKGEILVKSFFKERYALDFKKISTKKQLKTADFFIKKDKNKIGVAEVKDFIEIYPTEKNSYGYKKDDLGLWTKKDNSANRISQKIKESYKQLKNYNLPKILILVNYALDLDFLDLKGTLEGYLIYSDKDGNKIKNLSPYNKTQEKIKNKIPNFDAIFWIETDSKKILEFKNNLFCLYNNEKFIKEFFTIK